MELLNSQEIKEKLKNCLHDYSLSMLGVRLENSTITNNQKHILTEVNEYCDESFTIEEFKSTADEIVEVIFSKYYSDSGQASVLNDIVEYCKKNKLPSDNKVLDITKINKEFSTHIFSTHEVEFNIVEIYNKVFDNLVKRALEKSEELIKEKENEEKFKSAQSEDTKLKDKNASVAGGEANKSISDSDPDMSDKVRMFKLFVHDIANKANKVLNYLAMLADNNLDSGKKDEIIAILSANTKVEKKDKDGKTYYENYLKVFLSKEFLSNYFSYHNRKIKNGDLKEQGLNHLNDLLTSSSVNSAISYIISTMASCTASEIKDIPSSTEDIIVNFEKLKSFNESRTNYKFKRKPVQKLVFDVEDGEDRRTDEEKAADEEMFKRTREAFEKKVEEYGGIEKYNEYIKKLNEHKKLKNVVTVSGLDIEEVENCKSNDDYFECKSDIKSVLDDIIDYYTVMFDLSIKMGKFSGIYIFEDTNSGSKQDDFGVMEVVYSEGGEVKLRTINKKGSSLLKWLRSDYEYPLKSQGLKVARHNQVPNLENILVNGYNYYPAFIARYALGFVNKQKYSSFKSFISAVKGDVENRLYAIYKDKVTIDGKEYLGSDLFDASSKDRVKLVGAFVNSILFLTGQSVNGFDTAQLRCVSAYPHANINPNYYTEFKTTGTEYSGLSDAAQVSYIHVNNANSTNIIDITYIKDKDAFYDEVSWAYQELGKVYSTGEIPNVSKGGKVVIGQQLSGQLVEFDLGDNTKFTTSIYAGSRSGKGVTTLSILAAIMASRLPVCYLDCKPDMVNCFWEMEERASSNGLAGRTYAFDMNAGTPRLDYSGIKSLGKITDRKSQLYDTSVAEALLILKQLQMIAITGMYIQNHEKGNTTVWVFDEINNMINKLQNGFQIVISCAKKGNESDKELALKIFDFWRRVQASISRGLTDTWGQCGYKFICIGQKPGEIMSADAKIVWKEISETKGVNGADILKIIANAPVNKYILGRGLNINGGFGTKAFHNDTLRSSEEKDALEKHRYFIMREIGQVNATGGTKGEYLDKAVLFKPFLTLNFDDVTHGCWVGGLGSKFYNVKAEKNSAEYIQQLSEYKMSLNAEYGNNTKLTPDVLNSTDGKGVVDEGTGFYGLIKMYLGGSDTAALETVLKPYLFIDSILRKMDIIGENSMYGYTSLEEFLYDFSDKGMAITSYDEWKDIHTEYLAGNVVDVTNNNGSISSDYSIPDENSGTPKDSNSQEDNDVSSAEQVDLERQQQKDLERQKEAEQNAILLAEQAEDEKKKQDEIARKQAENEAKLAEANERAIEANNRQVALDVLHSYTVYTDRVHESLSDIKSHILANKNIATLDIQKLLNTRNGLAKNSEVLEGFALNISNNSFIVKDIEYTFDSLSTQKDKDLLNKVYKTLISLKGEVDDYIKRINDIESNYNDLQNGGDISVISQNYSNISQFDDKEYESSKVDVFNELQNQEKEIVSLEEEKVGLENEQESLKNEMDTVSENVNTLEEQSEQAKREASEIADAIKKNALNNNQTSQANNQASQGNTKNNNQSLQGNNINNSQSSQGNTTNNSQASQDNTTNNSQSSQGNNTNNSQSSQGNTSQNNGNSNTSGQGFGQVNIPNDSNANRVKASAEVSMTRGSEENAARTDAEGNTRNNDIQYDVENVIRNALPELDEDLLHTHKLKFLDNALIKRNQKDRYKIFINAVEEQVGWNTVKQLEMTSNEVVINKAVKVNVQSLGDINYNLYEVMNFSDLFFKHAIRLHTLIVDDEVSEILVAELGGDIYETLFNTTPTIQVMKIGKIVANRHKRNATMEMALKAEVERASEKSKTKNALTESLFASGQVKNNSENMAKALKILRRAEKSGRKTQTNKGLLTAQKIGQMTLPQAVGGLIGGIFIGIGKFISRR